jgi:hypothetical protein
MVKKKQKRKKSSSSRPGVRYPGSWPNWSAATRGTGTTRIREMIAQIGHLEGLVAALYRLEELCPRRELIDADQTINRAQSKTCRTCIVPAAAGGGCHHP